MSADKILTIFEILPIDIVDKQLLKEYVEFCVKNSTVKIKGKTSSHHILPAAKSLPFGNFSDLIKNDWNKSELIYSDHYKAHYLLMKAVNHFSTYFAFAAMHQKDFKRGFILEADLISKDEFSEIWKTRNEKIKSHLSETVSLDGNDVKRSVLRARNRIFSKDERIKTSLRMSGKNNIIHMENCMEKMRNTKLNSIVNGKNLDKRGADNAATTMKKEYIDNDGISTTTYKENGKKLSKTLSIIEINGKTKSQNRNAKIHKILREKGKWYKVFNIFDENFEKLLPAVEVRAISAALEKCCKEKYLGKSKIGENILKKKGKSELIGLFVEKIY